MSRTTYKTAASAYRQGQRVRYQSHLPWQSAANPHDWNACRATRDAFHRDGTLPPIPRGFLHTPTLLLGETAPFAFVRLRDSRNVAAGTANGYQRAQRNHAANIERLKAFPAAVYRGKTLIEHQTLVLAGIKRHAAQQRAAHSRITREMFAKTDGWKRYRRAELALTLRCHASNASSRVSESRPLAHAA